MENLKQEESLSSTVYQTEPSRKFAKFSVIIHRLKRLSYMVRKLQGPTETAPTLISPFGVQS